MEPVCRFFYCNIAIRNKHWFAHQVSFFITRQAGLPDVFHITIHQYATIISFYN